MKTMQQRNDEYTQERGTIGGIVMRRQTDLKLRSLQWNKLIKYCIVGQNAIQYAIKHDYLLGLLLRTRLGTKSDF